MKRVSINFSKIVARKKIFKSEKKEVLS